jgi:hypothetical protein
MGVKYTFGEAIDHVEQLKRRFDSHLNAALSDWAWSASLGDIYLGVLAETYLNVHRDPKKQREPIRLPKPWTTKPAAADVTPEEREELRASLARRSAFRDT